MRRLPRGHGGEARRPRAIGEAHVALTKSERFNEPTIEILSVTDFKAGLTPTIVFRAKDRNGYLTPSLLAPDPAMDANPGGGKTSPVPRSISSLSFYVAGPAAPDILTLNSSAYPVRETLNFAGTSTTPGLVLDPPDAEGRYTYTFTNKLPDGASGAWVVWAEARRTYGSTATPAKFYDAVESAGGHVGPLLLAVQRRDVESARRRRTRSSGSTPMSA